MRELLKNWKVLLLISLVLLSFALIMFKGIQFGVDFEGGTLFQIHLAEKAANPEQLASMRAIIEQRMDAFGLSDTKVNTAGDEYIVASIAETNPEKIEELESLLKTQGKFEAAFDGNILFSGSEIIQVIKDPRSGYGFFQSEGAIRWALPFSLRTKALERFTRMVFHRCEMSSYNPSGGNEFDCEMTYFFIDRPIDAVLLIPADVYEKDRELLLRGNRASDIPRDIDIDELLRNTMVPYIIVDENLSTEQLALLSELAGEKKYAIVPPTLAEVVRKDVEAIGFTLKEQDSISKGYFKDAADGEELVPWVWQVTGAQQAIALSAGVTNMKPFVANIEDAKIPEFLSITGSSSSSDEAEQRLTSLTILLETGSLPVPIESISKETISAYLGKEFLQATLVMGIIALVVVSLIIFVRYRRIELALPIILTGLSETVLVLGFASLISWSLDLAAVAGIIAAVGTGVDDKIVITDELMKGEKEEVGGSLMSKVKKAFFIVIASAATTIAMMLPILLFGFGMGKLVGFALTTISGILLGVLVARPAYAEIARYIFLQR